MRVSLATSLLALASAAMGWEIRLYSEEDCDAFNGAFSYMTVWGDSDLPWCIGPGSEGHFPPGVFCKHTWKNDNGEWIDEDCHAQVKTFKSWVVERGNFDFWEKYDEHVSQQESMRCSNKYKYTMQGEVFGPEDGKCRNAYYNDDYTVWGIKYRGDHKKAYFQGMGAWNAAL